MSTPSDPFGSEPFGRGPGSPPVDTAPTGRRPNMLATLSVIFAFVFAPAGAVLAHLGLAEIRRTGQSGRRRALVGMTASYAISVLAVAVVAAALLPTSRHPACACTTPPSVAAGSLQPTTNAAGKRLVAPTELAGLLSAPRDGDAAMTLQQTFTALTPMRGGVDPAGCLAVLSSVGDPRLYDTSSVSGHYRTDYVNTQSPGYAEVSQAVTAYGTAAAAAADRSRMTAGWGTPNWVTCRQVTQLRDGHTYTRFSDGQFSTDGFLVELEDDSDLLHPRIVHAVAAKANIVVDVAATDTLAHHADAAAIANAILAKIPG